MAELQAYLDKNRERYLEDLNTLLRFPSISSLPEHAGDVRAAGEWVAERLRHAGIEDVRLLETGGHPVVYGEWLHAPGKPTVAIYGHFDVQPVDPLELWTDDPFVPTQRDGRIYARGASDMKASLLLSIEAVEALLQTHGTLPVNLKFFLEGQEEIGSPQLPKLVSENTALLACDVVLSGDGLQWSDNEPMLVLGMRGGCGVQINVHSATGDLHSGLYGGAVPNPIHALVRLLDTLHAPDGTITVDGFMDNVQPLSDAEREAIAAIPVDEGDLARRLGASALVGEPGYSAVERMWARPTLELNGIWGGFQGEGVKTVIPCEAHAKITCRLVPDQDPSPVVDAIARHVERHTPPGVTVQVDRLPFTAMPYLIPSDHWGNRIVGGVLQEIYGVPPYETRLGGSVPVCETFLTNLGAYTVSMGFGQEDEGAHAPNEFVRLPDLERGRRAWTLVLQRMGDAQSQA